MASNNIPVQHPRFVPLLDLQRQYAGIREEVLAAIERVCSSQQFILGREVEELEGEVAQWLGVEAAVGCASGTDALWLAQAVAGIRPGDKVLTTAFSFWATASSIVRLGAYPIFVDVNDKTLNLDPLQLRRTLERHPDLVPGPKHKNAPHARPTAVEASRTAVLPVHLYGQCADMASLNAMAEEYGLVVIEDAAQAFGAKWNKRSAGSIGVSAAFSFYPTKNLSAYGEAGLLTTNNLQMAEQARRLRNHGSTEKYVHTELGWNARLDAIQAAVLRVKLKRIEHWNQTRRERADVYDRLFAKAGFWSLEQETRARNAQESQTGELSQPAHSPIERLERSPEAFHVFHQYVIRARDRENLRRFLGTRGVGTEVYYPVPLHLQPVFAYLGYKEGDLPESERAAKEVLALPMFPELTEDEQKFVVAAIAEFYS